MRTYVMRPVTSTSPATTGATVIVTSDAALVFAPSVTVRLKISGVFTVTAGAVNVGLAVVAPASVTLAPPVWVHAYCRGAPSGSELDSPLRRTVAPARTTRLGPPFALVVVLAPAAGTFTLAGAETPPEPVHVRE